MYFSLVTANGCSTSPSTKPMRWRQKLIRMRRSIFNVRDSKKKHFQWFLLFLYSFAFGASRSASRSSFLGMKDSRADLWEVDGSSTACLLDSASNIGVLVVHVYAWLYSKRQLRQEVDKDFAFFPTGKLSTKPEQGWSEPGTPGRHRAPGERNGAEFFVDLELETKLSLYILNLTFY